MVLGTHNLEPSRSTLLLFKIFKFHPLQVWTRFAKFGEIHIYTSPKIPPKFRQPLAAMRDHSTKNQLKEKSLHAKIILSNTWHALLLFIFSKIQNSVSFLRQISVTCKLCIWLVARSLSFLSGALHVRLAPSWRQWRPGPPAPACFAAAEPP